MTTPALNTAWERILARCAKGTKPSSFEMWIAPGVPVRFDADRIVLSYPPDVFPWTADKYAKVLGEAARSEGLAGVQLVPGEGD